MPSIEKNSSYWGDHYHWDAAGDEWSSYWGGVPLQWYGTILPRIWRFLPTGSVIEIAPGFGRWTQFLLPRCREYCGVDLVPRCVDACRDRFKEVPSARFEVNDGRSLGMVDDQSVDFVFSFDSLVHADRETLSAYIAEIGRVLKPEGFAFLHHSNLGEYREVIDLCDREGAALGKLRELGFQRLEREHSRAKDVSAVEIREICRGGSIDCVGQELINWGGEEHIPSDGRSGTGQYLIDCFSILRPKVSARLQPLIEVRNPGFVAQAANWRALKDLYG